VTTSARCTSAIVPWPSSSPPCDLPVDRHSPVRPRNGRSCGGGTMGERIEKGRVTDLSPGPSPRRGGAGGEVKPQRPRQ
jgi:hypothetical protein